jgi:hypothetical protein
MVIDCSRYSGGKGRINRVWMSCTTGYERESARGNLLGPVAFKNGLNSILFIFVHRILCGRACGSRHSVFQAGVQPGMLVGKIA